MLSTMFTYLREIALAKTDAVKRKGGNGGGGGGGEKTKRMDRDGKQIGL